jgi:hypothetical protein
MSGSGRTEIGPTGTLAMSGTSDRFLSQRTLANAGTTTWSGADIWASNGAVIENTGLFDVRADETLFHEIGAAVTFHNAGVLRRSTGTGTATLNPNVVVNNTGTVEALSGIFSLSGGGTSSGAFTA